MANSSRIYRKLQAQEEVSRVGLEAQPLTFNYTSYPDLEVAYFASYPLFQ